MPQVSCTRYVSVFVLLNAGYTVSVRGTVLNVLVLLTLASAGESLTCILHEGTHTPRNTRDQSIFSSFLNIVSCCVVLYCIVLYCIVLYCIVVLLYCIVLHGIVALHCIVLY